ncbi:MAG: hypothetical protein ACXW0Z_13100 [Gemmatirosa sp.]
MRTALTCRTSSAIGRGSRLLLGASALLLSGAAAAEAQNAGTDTRWRAWVGCWSPVDADGAVSAGAAVTCVVPAGPGVELLTIADGKVAARDRLDATGDRRARSQDGCEGWEQAQWSADGRRLHVRSAATCASGVTRSSSGLLAFAPDGDWLEVRSASVGTGAGVRVARYRPTSPATLPAEVASALQTSRRDEEVRLALGAPITTDEVADAVRLSDAPVVEAWLAARGQGFTLDARRLTQLADRGVPERVIDVMVALSYPKTFALNPATGEQQRRTLATADQGGQRPGPTAWLYPTPFGYGAYGWNPYRYGAYGYNSYYGNGYYGNGFYGGGWFPGGSPVVIVVRDPNGAPEERARAVNGRGYTRGRSSGTGTPSATPRASAGSGGYSPGGSSSGSSTGSSSSGSSSSEGGSGRKAKPRP